MLSVNVAKTNFILYTRVGKPNDINGKILFDNKHVVQVQEIRYLGFCIDCNLSWKRHSVIVATKVAHGLGAIRRFQKVLTSQSFIAFILCSDSPLYFVWAQIMASNFYLNFKRVQILQNTAMRLVLLVDMLKVSTTLQFASKSYKC